LDLRVIQRLNLRPTAAKLIRRHAAHAAVHASVAIHVRDVRVVDDSGAAREASTPEARIETASIPGMKHFKWR
jgi:hypothetical protein